MFNPFGEEIVWMYGPYEYDQTGGGRRRSMMFKLADGRKTSMPYARWLMTQHLQRRLEHDEYVDHINDDCLDDRIENLQILTNAENIRKSRLGKPSPRKGIENGWRHGTQYAWMKKKCNCDLCVEHKRKWNDARNERRRLRA